MEEEAPSRPSVAELAGRFKGSTRPHDAAGNEAEKPVRRRPPRSLQLNKTPGDDQEPPGVTSSLPAKAKRNSALIEKLQANLALSPTGLLPSPMSPGFRLLPYAFTPPSPSSAPVFGCFSSTPPPTSPVTASPWTEEESPASFEAPPTVAEGSILSNSNIKGRARHSIKRRPPSRRNRKSSSGEEVGAATEGEEASLSSSTEPEDKTTGGGGGGGGGGDQTDDVKEDKTDTSTVKNKSHEEDESKTSVETRGEDEKEEGSKGGEKEEGSSSGEKEEEKEEEKKEEKKEEEEEETTGEKLKEDSPEGETNTDNKEEEKSEETSESSAR